MIPGALREPHLKKVIAMDRLAEAGAVQPKASVPSASILEHLEEIADLYLAEGALERIRSGEERTIPLKQVLKWHGLPR